MNLSQHSLKTPERPIRAGQRACCRRLLGAALTFLLTAGSALPLYAKQFTDVSAHVGLLRDAKKSWGNPIWGDINNDGFIDLIVPTHGLASSGGPYVYLNQGGQTFLDIRATCGIEQAPLLDDGDWHGISFADYNSDGNLDVYVSEGAKGQQGGTIKRDLLFKGHGDGTFEYVSDVAGIVTSGDRGRSGLWFDYNNDGKLDLFVKNYAGVNVLYNGVGAGRLATVDGAGGLEKVTFGIGYGSVAAFADYDNDGFVDVSITGDGNTQEIYHNEGDGTFVNTSRSVGIQPMINAKGVAWGDYNNDGYPDFFVARGHQGVAGSGGSLYLNNGSGFFTDVTSAAGVSVQGSCWAAVWGDYDNDGYLDLFLTDSGDLGQGAGNANKLFHNNGDGTFTDVAATEGVALADGVSLHKTAAWGDYNNDGFLDLVLKDGVGGEEENGGGAIGLHYLFKNNGNSNHFLKVNLRGLQSELHGLGARVTVTSTNGLAFRQQDGGGGGAYSSQSSTPLHFGIGAATTANVEVQWPSGIVNVVNDVASNSTITITEGPTPPPVHPQNISTRLMVDSGSGVGIGGFIVTGTGTTQVIVRGLGPSLTSLGVTGALADPVLELHNPDGSVTTNDDWATTQEIKIAAAGLAPTDSKEAAIFANVTPGNYTAVLSGKSGAAGIGVVEVYDLEQGLNVQLANVSTRGFVGTGENVLIGGVIVGPTDAPSADLIIRAIGPSLGDDGVSGFLNDPILELHDKNGVLLATNDNWKDDPAQAAAITAAGLAPKYLRESAIQLTAKPEAYTAIVRGKAGTTGLALVEVYNIK